MKNEVEIMNLLFTAWKDEGNFNLHSLREATEKFIIKYTVIRLLKNLLLFHCFLYLTSFSLDSTSQTYSVTLVGKSTTSYVQKCTKRRNICGECACVWCSDEDYLILFLI